MSKWPPSTRFPYGYGKMDTLAGFANGIFLMLISIEIIYEAIERLAEGNRINKLGELLTVSTLGLVVNIVGLTAFGHAHHGHSHGGHSHGGHSHGEHSHAEHDHASHSHIGHHHENQHCHLEPSPHDHSHHDHGHHKSHKHDQPPLSAHAYLGHLHDHSTCLTPSTASMYSVPATPSKPLHSHSHAHSHGSHGHSHGHHDHGNENMQGIFLHVLADALGSVAVVISTILIHFYGWSGFDPLASCFIAIAIFASAVPLVTSSARTLLLTVPADTEYDLREALAGLSGLRGVTGYAVPKFWLEEGGSRKVLGVVHVIAGKMADMEDVKERVSAFLKSRNMDVVLQVEREGNDRCWCRAQK
ncbi:putative zinc transporter msc2 [Lecanora helva]